MGIFLLWATELVDTTLFISDLLIRIATCKRCDELQLSYILTDDKKETLLDLPRELVNLRSTMQSVLYVFTPYKGIGSGRKFGE